MPKDLIVHLDGTSEDEVRLSHAEAIAAGSGVHVTGLFTNLLPEYVMASGFDPMFSAIGGAAQLQLALHEEGERTAARLRERLGRIDALNELRTIEAGAGELPRLCASEARCVDLFVASSRPPTGSAHDWSNLAETILFEAGRAVYLVPPGRNAAPAIRRVLVAWRNTRESARAIAEALPFLGAAALTRIVTVAPKDAEKQTVTAVDVAAHLDRHGAKVEISIADIGEGTIAGILLDEARRMEADLIVMGAYGHSRFREWILGGVTRDMIAQSDTPILMAH